MPFQPIELFKSDLVDTMREIAVTLPVQDPPALVRVEPDSTTGDPAPGVRAELADAAWMLGRQWQLGELTGESAGTPVSVDVDSSARPITAWAPLDDASMADPMKIVWRPWPQGAVLEELVGDVPIRPGLRQRAEAGAQLVDMLDDAGWGAVSDVLLERYPLALDPDPNSPEEPVAGESAEEKAQRLAKVAERDALDPQAKRLLRVLAGTVPDGAAVARALEDDDTDWVSDADLPADDLRVLLAEWLRWWLGPTAVLQQSPNTGGAWCAERLEYRFALRFGNNANAVVLRGTRCGAAEIRWSDLDWVDAATPQLTGDSVGAPVTTAATVLATPLRYPGMPADRYWAMEDGWVDLAALEAQPQDLARLALAEFAMTSGDDWLAVPVDGLLGSINEVKEVRITDSFGDTVTVPEMRDPRFTLFRVSTIGGATLPGIVLPPVSAGTVTGEAVEEIEFLRDEMTNMAWAIERIVRGRSGDPRPRSAELRPVQPPWPPDLDPEERLYRLQALVPPEWIPLVPFAPSPGRVALRKGALLRDGKPIQAVSTTLAPTPLTFPDEEIPREGVHLRAVPSLARRADGSYAKWITYRVRVGTGSAASNLAWDSALSVAESRP
ncbi:hypothetical protein [Rhodococcus sp. NCIMB 12038]|uniref:hypothetical protein n=1 Tax=Rhodococcus sp. NCIMB 12038 TaxID=933800 RepID=UPI000B3C1FCD|nr:hypothetical protein [Rhodococcus sp. NCIMB 12038]OUS97408.1 hypothetical protein CA951_03440 [Rhodococcus sp. NCIMB 12038]